MRLSRSVRQMAGWPLLAAAVASLAVFLTWLVVRQAPPSAPNTAVDIDRPVYFSLEELSDASDAVVLGTVKGIVGREVDYGTADPVLRAKLEQSGIGLPIVFSEIAIAETLKGNTGTTLVVSRIDVETMAAKGKMFSEDVTPLRSGEKVILFLQIRTGANAAGIALYDQFYVAAGLDNGVFNVLPNGVVRPRTRDVAGTFSLSEIRDRVRGALPTQPSTK